MGVAVGTGVGTGVAVGRGVGAGVAVGDGVGVGTDVAVGSSSGGTEVSVGGTGVAVGAGWLHATKAAAIAQNTTTMAECMA